MALLFAGVFVACEETQEPPFPNDISIFAGDNQYSRVGTALDEPLTVTVRLPANVPAQRFTVVFQVKSGDATLSNSTDSTDDAGQASTLVTLGMTQGQVVVRAILSDDETQYVDFTATAGLFFCPEEDPAFQRKFNNEGDLYLFTRHSKHNESEGEISAGVVRITPQFTPAPARFTSSSVVRFPESVLNNVPKDCAFGRNGDFYMSHTELFTEAIKLEQDRSYGRFAFLDDVNGSELDTSPGLILAGCDAYGPFALGCRDTLARFTEATYTGVGEDACNNDAFAVDQASQDMYFIYDSDNMLKRLSLDSLVVQGPLQDVAQLSEAEADSSYGMVVAENGNIFILVDAASTKQILRITPGGTKTVEVDFATRGAGAAAGKQRDLALWRIGLGVLFTIHTENNVLLAWDITQGTLTELVPDASQSIPEAVSLIGSSGERIGLSVLP